MNGSRWASLSCLIFLACYGNYLNERKSIFCSDREFYFLARDTCCSDMKMKLGMNHKIVLFSFALLTSLLIIYKEYYMVKVLPHDEMVSDTFIIQIHQFYQRSEQLLNVFSNIKKLIQFCRI